MCVLQGHCERRCRTGVQNARDTHSDHCLRVRAYPWLALRAPLYPSLALGALGSAGVRAPVTHTVAMRRVRARFNLNAYDAVWQAYQRVYGQFGYSEWLVYIERYFW